MSPSALQRFVLERLTTRFLFPSVAVFLVMLSILLHHGHISLAFSPRRQQLLTSYEGICRHSGRLMLIYSSFATIAGGRGFFSSNLFLAACSTSAWSHILFPILSAWAARGHKKVADTLPLRNLFRWREKLSEPLAAAV